MIYKFIKRMLEQDNYDSIQDMRNKIDVFYSVTPARLTESEYKELNDTLNAKQTNTVTPE
jgi:hypothetical protein